MEQASTQTAAVTCPNCGRRFNTPVHSIIDVGQDPTSKDRLLRGHINAAVCPQCGMGVKLNAPFLYHDPQKELLFAYTPPTTTMDNDQQQRIIGSLINRVMTSLLPEQRKGYLFQPRTFLSLDTLQQEIVMAEGVSRQELESQKRKLHLLERLIGATSDEVIKIIAQENEKDLDYEFFLLFRAVIEEARDEGDEARAGRLEALHHKLLQYSDTAREADVETSQIVSQQELMRRLLEMDDEQQQKSLVVAARPLLDYGFFQSLTGMIEEAQQANNIARADQLLQLRARLLAWIDEIDATVKKMWERKARLLQEMLQDSDWRTALESHWQEIDAMLLSLLAGNIEMAEKQGNKQFAAALQQFTDLAMVVAREHAPPEIQLLNQLFEADYPEGTQRILAKHRDQLNADFIQLLDTVIKDMAEQELAQDIKTAKLIRAQVAAMLGA